MKLDGDVGLSGQRGGSVIALARNQSYYWLRGGSNSAASSRGAITIGGNMALILECFYILGAHVRRVNFNALKRPAVSAENVLGDVYWL